MTRLLIIDDDAELFGLLRDYLKGEGFECSHAAGGDLGLREAAKGGYDAVILDVMLPGMNGFEVLRRLRSSEVTASIPVLMLTARGEEVDRVVGLEMGADDYLPKPFSPRELVARLRALLRRAALPRTQLSQPDIQKIDDMDICRASLSVTVNHIPHNLTVPELRLLELLLGAVGEVVNRDILYKTIFGHQAYPMDRSLDMLVSRLRKKLGHRANGSERIKAVRGEGYMYLLPGEDAAQ